MKKAKIYLGLALGTIVLIILVAADYIDTPFTSADITSFYAFEPTPGSDKTVFMVDFQTGFLPDVPYGTFDENVLTEINIDLDGDLIEDKVIQAIPRDGIMYFFGPAAPSQKGRSSQLRVEALLGSVEISAATVKTTTTTSGVKLFAGSRQDAFYFDFFQFALNGGSTSDRFKAPEEAEDVFDGANTLCIVIELPNTMLGTPTAKNALGVEVYKTWVTSNKKE